MLKRPKPLNARQEKFAHLCAGGMAATPAYIAAGYKVGDKVAGVNSCRLILGNARVSALIAKLRAETCGKLDLSRDQLAKHLWAVIMTPISQLTPDSPLVQEYEEITTRIGKDGRGEKRIRLRVKMMDKIAAARLLVDMMGWKEPERQIHQIGQETLASLQEQAKLTEDVLSKAYLARTPATI